MEDLPLPNDPGPALLTALPRRWMLIVTGASLALLVTLCSVAMTRGYWVGLVVPVAVMLASFVLAGQRSPAAQASLPGLDPLG